MPVADSLDPGQRPNIRPPATPGALPSRPSRQQYPGELLIQALQGPPMIPRDKKRVNATLVPAMVAQLDRLARYWGVHRSTVISAALNAGLQDLEALRTETGASPDRGKAVLKDLAATQLELPLPSRIPPSLQDINVEAAGTECRPPPTPGAASHDRTR